MLGKGWAIMTNFVLWQTIVTKCIV